MLQEDQSTFQSPPLDTASIGEQVRALEEHAGLLSGSDVGAWACARSPYGLVWQACL